MTDDALSPATPSPATYTPFRHERRALRAQARAQKIPGKAMLHAHWRVAQTAKTIAGEMYEVTMRDNLVFDNWKKQHPGYNPAQLERAFIAKYWGVFIPPARATLARLLTHHIDKHLKDEIEEALILDAQLMRGREQGQRVLGSL